MRLLLDTHTFLWWREGSTRLPDRVGDRIRDPDNDVIVSIASLWEIAIKRTLGKLGFAEDFEQVMMEEAFELLDISYVHLRLLESLPQHHRDPFDRLLIAQSLADRIPIVTADPAFAAYATQTMW